MRPYIFLRWRSQHYRRDLDKGFIVFRKLKSGIFEGFAKIVELGKIDVTGGARCAVLARKSWDRITASGQQCDCEDESKKQEHPTPCIHLIAPLRSKFLGHSPKLVLAGFGGL
jgi:hypothetical protein